MYSDFDSPERHVEPLSNHRILEVFGVTEENKLAVARGERVKRLRESRLADVGLLHRRGRVCELHSFDAGARRGPAPEPERFVAGDALDPCAGLL